MRTMLIGVLRGMSRWISVSIARTVACVREEVSFSNPRASASTDVAHASRLGPSSPAHSRSRACCQVSMSLVSSAKASLTRTLLIPSRALALPLTLPMASIRRARSAVNSTLPMLYGRRARPTMSPGARRSRSVRAVRSTVRDEPARRLFSSTTKSSRRPLVATSFDVRRASRGVGGVSLVDAVETNCTDWIGRGWPFTCRSKSAAVRVRHGIAVAVDDRDVYEDDLGPRVERRPWEGRRLWRGRGGLLRRERRAAEREREQHPAGDPVPGFRFPVPGSRHRSAPGAL